MGQDRGGRVGVTGRGVRDGADVALPVSMRSLVAAQ